MKTKALYLEDAYATTMNAEILEVVADEPGRWRVVLDQTIFYPLGGGQPTDQGVLKGTSWQGDVNQVKMKDDEIWHYIIASEPPTVGMQVSGEIDWTRRHLNMRRHSAGHIIDFALVQMGLVPSILSPLKGDHGKKSYIVYGGSAGRDIKAELQSKTNELISQNLAFTTRFAELEELQKVAIYLQPGLPSNKPLRMLTLDTVGSVADGGTQIKTTGEVGTITIGSLEEKEGQTIVTYSIG